MQIATLKTTGSGSHGGVGRAVHSFGGHGYSTMIFISDGEAEIGPARIRVGSGVAILAEPAEAIEFRPLTEPVQVTVLEFWPGAPLPELFGPPSTLP